MRIERMRVRREVLWELPVPLIVLFILLAVIDCRGQTDCERAGWLLGGATSSLYRGCKQRVNGPSKA